MKKSKLILLAILLLVLSGCTSIDGYWGKVLVQKSGVLDDKDYQEYQRLVEENKLNEEGYYIGTDQLDKDLSEEKSGVHVTFADNRYLTIYYSKDAEHTQPIRTEDCYLEPGDRIYLVSEESNNPNTNLYGLAAFRIYEYDAEGNRGDLLYSGAAMDGLVYEIPADFEGTEISILPIGAYQNRVLIFNDYYRDEDGTIQGFSEAGKWAVSGETYEEDYAEISSLGEYIVRYTYDAEKYFYVASEPECFMQNSEKGIVEFYEESNATEDTKYYYVELHPYLTLSIQLDEAGEISLNGNEKETIKKDKTWTNESLKYGDKIIIETSGKYEIIGGDYRHIQESSDPINGGYRYILKVVQETSSDTANRKIYTVTLDSSAKYGECVYIMDGKEVNGTIDIEEGKKLTLKYTITDSDYKFAQRTGGVIGFLKGILNDKEQTVSITITADLDGTVIRPDETFQIIKKEG